METLETNRAIRTFSGEYIDVFDPSPAHLHIEDIAHGLAYRCRFGGHTKNFHSVAEHCIHISDMCPPHLRLQALLHDASEAYIGDMPTPIKQCLPDFQSLENRLMEAIGLKFGFSPRIDPFVKALDKSSLEWEWENKVLNDNVKSMEPERVKALFLMRFQQITKHF